MPPKLDDLTDEQKQLVDQLLQTSSDLSADLRRILPPAKARLVVDAFDLICERGGYGSVEIVVADGKAQNINGRFSLR